VWSEASPSVNQPGLTGFLVRVEEVPPRANSMTLHGIAGLVFVVGAVCLKCSTVEGSYVSKRQMPCYACQLLRIFLQVF
jgi:hypothetical protein